MNALLKFTQGLRTSEDGHALIVEADTPVTIFNSLNTEVASWRIELLWGPPSSDYERTPGSALVLAQNPDNNEPTYDFTPQSGFTGCYRIRLTVWTGTSYSGSYSVDIRCIGVPTANRRYIKPPFQKLPDCLPLPLTGHPLAKPNEMNFEGQPFGWCGADYNHEIYGATFERFRLLDALIDDLDSSGGVGGGGEPGVAPLEQWVDGTTGNDSAAGTELAPLLTVEEALTRIGNNHGDALINVVAAGEYYVMGLSQPRTGRGSITIRGAAALRTYIFEDADITSITLGSVVTDAPVTQDNNNNGDLTGCFAYFSGGVIAAVINNDVGTTIKVDSSLFFGVDDSQTVSVGYPSVRLASNNQNCITGSKSPGKTDGKIIFENVELIPNGGTLNISGNVEFRGATFDNSTGSTLRFYDTYHTTFNYMMGGFSVRTPTGSNGTVYMHRCYGQAINGFLGNLQLYDCGGESGDGLQISGGSKYVYVYNSKVYIYDDYWFAAGGGLLMYAGAKVKAGLLSWISSVFFNDNEQGIQFRFANDFSSNYGVDLSFVGAMYTINGTYLERFM